MVTSNDVARLAGVSQPTVSRALSGSTNVSEDVRARVSAAAEALGYEPNVAARNLRRRHSETIALGFFAGDVWALAQLDRPEYYFYLGVLRRIEAQAAVAGYELLLPPRPAARGSESYLRALRARRATGVIMIACPQTDARVQALIESELPTIFVDTLREGPRATYVTSDTAAAAGQVVEHLLGLGHRRIARVDGAVDVATRNWARGFRVAMAAAELPDDPALVRATDWTTRGAYQATAALLAERRDFTAIAVESDTMAIGVLRAVHEAGLRVPADISVVGSDDIELCQYLEPPLTTVRHDPEALGAHAVDALIALIENAGAEPPHPTVLPTRLVVRASTAPPRAENTNT